MIHKITVRRLTKPILNVKISSIIVLLFIFKYFDCRDRSDPGCNMFSRFRNRDTNAAETDNQTPLEVSSISGRWGSEKTVDVHFSVDHIMDRMKEEHEEQRLESHLFIVAESAFKLVVTIKPQKDIKTPGSINVLCTMVFAEELSQTVSIKLKAMGIEEACSEYHKIKFNDGRYCTVNIKG